MTLAAENIALKAEVARLREALDAILDLTASEISTRFPNERVAKGSRIYSLLVVPRNIASGALDHPAPTTPETDKAQAVIDAACGWHTRAFTLGTGSRHEGLGRRDLWEAVANYKKAVGIALPSVRPSVPPMQNEHFYDVEAYRGGA